MMAFPYCGPNAGQPPLDATNKDIMWYTSDLGLGDWYMLQDLKSVKDHEDKVYGALFQIESETKRRNKSVHDSLTVKHD
jgi:hypothetical protein